MEIWKNNKLNLSDDEISKLKICNSHEDELSFLFRFIKSRGWIKYSRIQGNSDGLLGNIFEDLIGLRENNDRNADYFHIEIKTKNNNSSSNLVSLFGYCLDSVKSANTEIREKFGALDEKSFKKIFNSTIKYDQWNTHRSGFNFKLEDKNERLYLRIFDTFKKAEIDYDKYFWTYNEINRRFSKINNCFYVEGEIDKINKMVKYSNATLYKDAEMSSFLNLLKNKEIVMDFRIGVYKSGKNEGKSHDHGTGFRIKQSSIPFLFKSSIKIE